MKTSRMARIGRAWWLPVLFLLAITITVKAETSGDFVYTINPNGTVRIDEYTNTSFGGALTVPSNIVDRTVVGIGRYAFSASTTLTSVTVPNSIIYIEEYAFNECTSLAGVTIGTGVTNIGFRVFNYCTNLTVITVDVLNSSFSSLAGVLFNNSQTTLIQYPGGKAGAYTIPNSVTSIGKEAFASCTRLTSVTIGNSVASIGEAAFWGCTSLTSVTIPNSVTSIGMDAFSVCTGLADVTIGTSVASIGGSAFYECTSLASVIIPASVTNIGSGAFVRCTSLTAITVDAGNSVYSSLAGVLFNKNQTTLIQCPGGKAGAYTIPGSVTSIGNGAFYWCTSLAGVTIPASVTSIGDNGFHFCTSLAGITIPNSVTNIGYYAFESCTSLGSVTLPTGIASIKYWTFVGCTSLNNVTVPASVTSIGDDAFASCINLTGVYFRGNAPGGGTNVFYNDTNAIVYYVAGTTGWEPTFSGRPTALWDAPPKPMIRANGTVGTVTVNYPAAFSITVEMDAGSYVGTPVDWWIVVCAGSSWYYMDSVAGWTQEGAWRPVLQGGLFNLPTLEVLNIAGLATGLYTFYFAIEYPMDGILNTDGLMFSDSVNVIVQ
ncbi:MAG: leucine-rich repeat domain-containing protein [Kiritimatiellota bacterium]|nr:leucine-rich repeat domain-containing protein [Kiritimatiellota bacterium]